MKKGEAKLLLDDNRILLCDESWLLNVCEDISSVYGNQAKKVYLH